MTQFPKPPKLLDEGAGFPIDQLMDYERKTEEVKEELRKYLKSLGGDLLDNDPFLPISVRAERKLARELLEEFLK